MRDNDTQRQQRHRRSFIENEFSVPRCLCVSYFSEGVSTVVLLPLAMTPHTQTSLAERIQAGHRKAAVALIAQGADVNQAQPDGSTPLHWRCAASIASWSPRC